MSFSRELDVGSHHNENSSTDRRSPASYCETSDSDKSEDSAEPMIHIISSDDSDDDEVEADNDVTYENHDVIIIDDDSEESARHAAKQPNEPEVSAASLQRSKELGNPLRASFQQSFQMGKKCRRAIEILKKFPLIETPVRSDMRKFEEELSLLESFEGRSDELREDRLQELNKLMTENTQLLLGEIQKLNATPVSVVEVNDLFLMF